MDRSRRIVLLILLVLVSGCRQAPHPSPVTGSWRAWLDSPGGPLPFGLELGQDGSSPAAWLINGEERAAVPRVEIVGRRIVLSIAHYDAVIEATLDDDGRRMDGEWRRTAGPDRVSRLPFHASVGPAPRFDPGPAPTTATLAAIGGRWAVDFETDELPAVAVFEAAPDGRLGGTFLTATGDYRYLAGRLDRERLRLSVFDGAHAFLFDARLAADGTLAGDFWSRDAWHERWTARKDPQAEVPDAFAQARWIEGADLGGLQFPDLNGRDRSLDAPEFGGAARILLIFGSWCPNCNDMSEYMVELDRRYRGRGLSILGLAFEHTGEFERDAEQVRVYAAHHGIEYPLLLAGLSDKGEASRAFPLIDRVRAFPTTIFLRRDGRVRAVHSGFSGPATGAAHVELRARFVELIEGLLAEEQGS